MTAEGADVAVEHAHALAVAPEVAGLVNHRFAAVARAAAPVDSRADAADEGDVLADIALAFEFEVRDDCIVRAIAELGRSVGLRAHRENDRPGLDFLAIAQPRVELADVSADLF